MTILLALLACGLPADADTTDTAAATIPTASTPYSVDDTAPADTAGPADTASTTDTGAGTPDVPTAAQCAAVSLSAPTFDSASGPPTSFAPRPDGSFWFAADHDGVWQGSTLGSAALVHAEAAQRVVEDPYGVLHVLGDGALYRAEPGGPLEVVTLGLYFGTTWSTDLEAHPSGTVAFTWHGGALDSGASEIVVVEADGTVTREAFDGVNDDIIATAVAWSADFDTLWLLASEALWRMDVDDQGIPDRSTLRVEPTPPIVGGWGSDLAVDACGGVLIYAIRGNSDGAVFRYDPSTGDVQSLGVEFEQGYAESPLRFGTAPGATTEMATMTARWGSTDHQWLRWQVGVGAPAWP